MTAPSHIRAWVAVNYYNAIVIEDIRRTEHSAEIVRADEDYAMTLDELIKKAAADFAALSPEAQAQQRASWPKAEMSWPKAKFHWEFGVKVYKSYEDYCND